MYVPILYPNTEFGADISIHGRDIPEHKMWVIYNSTNFSGPSLGVKMRHYMPSSRRWVDREDIGWSSALYGNVVWETLYFQWCILNADKFHIVICLFVLICFKVRMPKISEKNWQVFLSSYFRVHFLIFIRT